MSLLNTIKIDQIKSRKDRNIISANLLTALLGEASMIGKNNGNRESTDEEVISVVKKFIKNAEETKNALSMIKSSVSTSQTPLDTIKMEISILNNYLPKQLSEQELTTIINEYRLKDTQSSMSTIMKYLKDNYNGKYDGKMASNVVRTILN